MSASISAAVRDITVITTIPDSTAVTVAAAIIAGVTPAVGVIIVVATVISVPTAAGTPAAVSVTPRPRRRTLEAEAMRVEEVTQGADMPVAEAMVVEVGAADTTNACGGPRGPLLPRAGQATLAGS